MILHMNEDSIDELQEADSWDWDQAETLPGNPAAGVVVGIRLSATEFEDLAAAAERSAVTATEFARRATVSAAREQVETA